MQENRSFDSYFGTYPGARADHHDSNKGGPHGTSLHWADVDHGKMDGFIARAEKNSSGAPVGSA